MFGGKRKRRRPRGLLHRNGTIEQTSAATGDGESGAVLTEAGVDSTVSGSSDAVTTIVWLSGCWVARKRTNARRFTRTSLRSCERLCPKQPVSWLPGHPPHASLPIPLLQDSGRYARNVIRLRFTVAGAA